MNSGERETPHFDFTAAGFFVALAIVYWTLRCPTFGPGDSPQHVLSAVTWGVSWPPGYPLYTMLAHAFSLLPGSAASNVNGFSGLLHAAAAAVFYLTLRRMALKPVPALIAAALLGLSPLFWYYSEIAEVRALNDLLATTAAYFTVAWSQDRTDFQWFSLAAVLGFGVSHHPTYILILPALLSWFWMSRSFPTGRRLAGFAAVFALCCALPYLILGLRLELVQPAYNLTGVATFSGVMDLFLRKNLGGPLRMVAGRGVLGGGSFDFPAFREHMGWFVRSLAGQVTPFGAGLAALGAARTCRAQKRVLVFWSAWLLVSGLIFVGLSSQQLHLHDQDFARAVAARFYLLPMIGAFALAGFGAQWLLEYPPRPVGWAALAAVVALSATIRPIDLRRRNFTMDYAREIVRGTGPSDMLIVDTDASNFALLYLDLVEHSTQDRVLLIPSLLNDPPYLDWLRARHPALHIPVPDSLMAWNEWLRLNPGRNLYAEAEWKDALLPQFPGSAPEGVMIHVSSDPPPPDSTEKEARFLAESPVVRAAVRGAVYPFGMDVTLLNAYRILGAR